jgi:hypothetical protein
MSPLLTAVEEVLLRAAFGLEPETSPAALVTIRELRRRLLSTRRRRQETFDWKGADYAGPPR